MHDVIIIGGGPAGLSAGIYAVRRGLSTLILEKKILGGQLPFVREVENYPGFKSILGKELADRMVEQVKQLGVEFLVGEMEDMNLKGEIKSIKTKEGEHACRAVIIATGGEYQKLGVSGEKEFTGRGVSYCPTCDAPFFRDKIVAVVGGGNRAVSDALYLSDVAKEVYLIHRRDKLRAEQASQEKLKEKGVKPILNAVVEEFHGDVMLKSIRIKDVETGIPAVLNVQGVFISVGTIPHTEVEKKNGVAVDEKGFIKVDRNQKTNISGVYAAGDVTGGVMQISTAVGEGCVAALSAYEHIREPYWKKKG
ncbi:MAG: thioredoxin-disulfide reductase [Candidatus Altiarchaeota archaeon]|nr:thioredoxin-disulfide reductase [Candidatus Altiarchaeota archaeon]